MQRKAHPGDYWSAEEGRRDTNFRARAILRSETMDLHRRAEELIGNRPFEDRASYAELLRSNLAVTETILRAVEPLLPQALTRGITTDVERLRADLCALSEQAACDCATFEVRDPAVAIGAVYVMEGARLGGTVLARQAKVQLGLTAATGATYLNGEGKGAGYRWQGFLAALEQRLVLRDDISRAVMAARDTFRLVILQYERM